MFFLNKRSNFEKKRTNLVIDPIYIFYFINFCVSKLIQELGIILLPSFSSLHSVFAKRFSFVQGIATSVRGEDKHDPKIKQTLIYSIFISKLKFGSLEPQTNGYLNLIFPLILKLNHSYVKKIK